MIYENVLLHNVPEVLPVNGGVRLQRLPEEVRLQLNPKAQERALMPFNCEIRFAMEGDEAQVTLSSEGETQLRVFHGPFDGKTPWLIGPDPTTITVSRAPVLAKLDRRWWQDQPFDPNVFRCLFGGRGPVILHGIQGKGVRPPSPEQLPKITYLAYGTSITQGAKSQSAPGRRSRSADEPRRADHRSAAPIGQRDDRSRTQPGGPAPPALERWHSA